MLLVATCGSKAFDASIEYIALVSLMKIDTLRRSA